MRMFSRLRASAASSCMARLRRNPPPVFLAPHEEVGGRMQVPAERQFLIDCLDAVGAGVVRVVDAGRVFPG